MVKNPPANSGVTDLIPGSGRSSAEGKGNPLQYSCLGNPVDTGTWHWQAISPCGHRELAMMEATEHKYQQKFSDLIQKRKTDKLHTIKI